MPSPALHAEFVKSKAGGATAKSFNINFARLYDQLGNAPAHRATSGAATTTHATSSSG